MFDKLEDLVARLDELQNELSDPNVASNAERFRNLMKEQANLAPIVEKYQEYKEAKQTIEDSLSMLEGESDEEMREMLKEELSSAPENTERNWLYVTSVNRFLLLYTGEDWEEPAIINSLNKCGWCILGFSALSYHYYND